MVPPEDLTPLAENSDVPLDEEACIGRSIVSAPVSGLRISVSTIAERQLTAH